MTMAATRSAVSGLVDDPCTGTVDWAPPSLEHTTTTIGRFDVGVAGDQVGRANVQNSAGSAGAGSALQRSVSDADAEAFAGRWRAAG